MRVIRYSMLNGRVTFVSGCYFLTVKMCGICVVLCQSTQHNVSHCSCQNVVAKVSASGPLPSQLEPRSGSFSGLWCGVDVAKRGCSECKGRSCIHGRRVCNDDVSHTATLHILTLNTNPNPTANLAKNSVVKGHTKS